MERDRSDSLNLGAGGTLRNRIVVRWDVNYSYRLEDVDAEFAERLKKEKEAQRKKEEEAWKTELPQAQRELPGQPKSVS